MLLSHLTFLSSFGFVHLQSPPHNAKLTILPSVNLFRGFFCDLVHANLSSLIFLFALYLVIHLTQTTFSTISYLFAVVHTDSSGWSLKSIPYTRLLWKQLKLLSLGCLPNSQIKFILPLLKCHYVYTDIFIVYYNYFTFLDSQILDSQKLFTPDYLQVPVIIINAELNHMYLVYCLPQSLCGRLKDGYSTKHKKTMPMESERTQLESQFDI